jgi:hypothetical protein
MSGGGPTRIARLSLSRALLVFLFFLSTVGSSAAQTSPLAIGVDSVRVVYWPGDEGLAQRALRAASTPLRLPGLPTAAPRMVGTIVLAPTQAHYRAASGGAAPEWSAGVAQPGQRLIVLPAFPSSRTPGGDPIGALRHERVHLALHAYLGDAIPRWFDEGYATWAAGEWDEGTGWEIRLAFLRGAAPPLDSLTLDWPRRAADARLAYLLSASAVRFLSERGGEPVLAAFFEEWRDSGSVDAAFRSVYLTTPAHFEDEWRAMVKRRYGWLLAISQVGIFWMAVTGLFLLLGMARRRRDRVALDRMAATEADESGTGEGDLWRLPEEYWDAAPPAEPAPELSPEPYAAEPPPEGPAAPHAPADEDRADGAGGRG